MTVSNGFLEYIIDQLAKWGDVTAKRMFGGAGLYCDGKMFGLVSNRPTILSYYEVPGDIVEDPEELIEWADESLSIQMKPK
jgi:DNA transformation protein